MPFALPAALPRPDIVMAVVEVGVLGVVWGGEAELRRFAAARSAWRDGLGSDFVLALLGSTTLNPVVCGLGPV